MMFCCQCIVSSGISITCVIAHFVSTISADGKPHTYIREYSRPRARRCFVGLFIDGIEYLWFIVVKHFMPDSWGVAV